MAEDVLGVQAAVVEGDGGDEVDEGAEVALLDLQLGVGLVEDVLQLGVLLLHGIEGIVDEFAQ